MVQNQWLNKLNTLTLLFTSALKVLLLLIEMCVLLKAEWETMQCKLFLNGTHVKWSELVYEILGRYGSICEVTVASPKMKI